MKRLSDALLLETYFRAKKSNLPLSFISLIEKEITHRQLVIPKEYQIIEKQDQNPIHLQILKENIIQSANKETVEINYHAFIKLMNDYIRLLARLNNEQIVKLTQTSDKSSITFNYDEINHVIIKYEELLNKK